MISGKQIEAARVAAGLPIYILCNAMDLVTESEYKTIVDKNKIPTVYQQIMVFTVFEEFREYFPTLF